MAVDEEMMKLNLSFAGCGFMCIYHAGVIAAVKEYAPQLTANKISGASAGAIAAAGLLCNVCISKSMDIILNVVRQARAGSLRALNPMFNLIGMVRDGLEQILPPNAHILCHKRLFISMTRARDYQNVVVSEYDTREELIQAIVCSSFIPFYCGRTPPHYRGEAYIDGGMSNNQPFLDNFTVSVSPFSGESDICPIDVESASMLGINFYGSSVRCTAHNLFRIIVCLFPPSQDVCAEICRQGFADALRFLRSRGLAPCARCLTVEARVFAPVKIAALRASSAPMRRTKTMPNFSTRRRVEECERCSEKFEVNAYYSSQNFHIPLPELVQKTLDEALAAESQWFRYLRTFRVFRWTMRLMTPVIFPLEVAMYTARRMRAFVGTYTSADYYLQRVQQTVDFVLAEIDSRALVFDNAQISCAFRENPLATSSSVPTSPTGATAIPTTTARARAAVAAEAANVCSSADEYQSVASNVPSSYFSCDAPPTFDVTTEWSDEPSHVRFCDSDASASSEHPKCCVHAVALHSHPHHNHHNNHRPCSPVMENSDKFLACAGCGASADATSEAAGGEDSGLSLTEDSNPAIVRKRDSACSPMRQPIYRSSNQRSIGSNLQRLSAVLAAQEGRGGAEGGERITSSSTDDDDGAVGKSRRHTISGSRRSLPTNKSPTNSAASGDANSVGGSLMNVSATLAKVGGDKMEVEEEEEEEEDDDDDEDGKLFVPARRKPRAKYY